MFRHRRRKLLLPKACLLPAFLVSVAGLSFGQSPAIEAYRAGERAYQRLEIFEAFQHYETALDINPSYAEPMVGLARLLFYLGEYDEALGYVNQARPLLGFDPPSMALRGRILVGLGRTVEAEEAFRAILARRPNNAEALAGLAELSIAEGRIEEGRQRFEELRRRVPEDRRTLLSLAFLSEFRGNPEEAESFIQRALRSHGLDPVVNAMAAEFYLRRGRADRAVELARRALELSNGEDTQEVLLRALLEQGDVIAAEEVSRQLLRDASDRLSAWFLRALVLERLGRTEDALNAMDRLLALAPGEEVPRIVAEDIALRGLEPEAGGRQELADYRYDRSRELTEENLFSRAKAAVRRALRLDPYSGAARELYAELLRFQGFRSRFLRELTILDALGEADVEIRDTIEGYESLLVDEVAATWELAQFELERRRLLFGVFALEDEVSLPYPGAAGPLGRYVRDHLFGVEALEPAGNPVEVRSLSEAFSAARTDRLDYYIIVGAADRDRALNLRFSLFSGRTGGRIGDLETSRSGPYRLERAVYALVLELESRLPRYGRILSRSRNVGAVSLGRVDGIEVGDELTILRSGGLLTRRDALGFEYSQEAVLGSATVTAVDDLVSEITIVPEGFTDVILVGDDVILPGEEVVASESPLFPLLYNRIRAIP
jgi:tetratricopeptide (TPR) repeat protein